MTCCCRTLNRIQSRIYRTAFYSNENILVCAPTGAGKTNIAMIAILREVAANMQQGQIQRHAFKIVYVAPMKALAAEQTATFSRRLADLGAGPLSDVFPDSCCVAMQKSSRELLLYCYPVDKRPCSLAKVQTLFVPGACASFWALCLT